MKILSSEITPYKTFLNRRKIIKLISYSSLGLLFSKSAKANHEENVDQYTNLLDKDDTLNNFEEITNYNNFYEFGLGKEDPAKYSNNFQPSPWSIRIEGLVNSPGDYHIEDILKGVTIEDRVYRLRCVEGWSMVIPWQGFSLKDLIKKVKPDNRAKYIQFETVYRPEEMPGQLRNVLPWPYVEGLRMDEAMHSLSILSTGLYGHNLLNQNGAPIRLVVPWKYGFKSIKSIVKMRFVDNEPTTTWSKVNPREYGFYSNVNPEVHHPRWTQGTERRIGEFYRRPTLMFNGYADQVSNLYKGMDLKKFY
tara:strand:+ start:3439 stop:4356 length:918 start_codon:yes stop_codon:yes gene_type:complete